ncbi:MAG: 4a-hydroxytetrahydrobiopterin dehydratase [Variovorax paradoxus]|nr:MAG: 4a-hydroxytetrahydrobiopterin dehydratase [Variovorax paradoxus]PZQ15275.1 MAG: 4a-hydroxytetrahydrobiopterin dehydratase [Variovorax paradoxus]
MRLSPAQLQPLLVQLPAWQANTERGGTLSRRFLFRDFAQAMGFMCQIAVHAEKHDHHPEWFNVYNRVDVTLTTHDAGGLSLRDIRLARTMDQVAAALAQQAAPFEEHAHA